MKQSQRDSHGRAVLTFYHDDSPASRRLFGELYQKGIPHTDVHQCGRVEGWPILYLDGAYYGGVTGSIPELLARLVHESNLIERDYAEYLREHGWRVLPPEASTGHQALDKECQTCRRRPTWVRMLAQADGYAEQVLGYYCTEHKLQAQDDPNVSRYAFWLAIE